MFIKNLQKYKPKNEYSLFVKEYFSEIEKYWTKKFIKNIEVEMKFIEIDNILIPLSFWNLKENCYTTSILWSIKYALEELEKDKNTIKRIIYKFFLKSLYNILKIWKIEENIFVFNLFLSTILYPQISEKTIKNINNFLQKNFPNKAIIYRWINSDITKNLKEILEKEKFYKIASRQIFYFLPKNKENIFKNKSYKEDKRVFEKMWFAIKWDNFSEEEIWKIKECYDELYLEKYSFYNPQFTQDFYKNILKNPFFSINCLIDKDVEAVFGYYTIDKQSTTPIFWYKEKNNFSKKLYRQITYLTIKEVLEKWNILNHSSWVWKFKLNRWTKFDIEYIFVYYQNLPFFQKFSWRILIIISKYFIEKELKNNIY